MKIKVPEDLLIGIKEYFKKSAFTFQHRKTLQEIRRTFPLSPSRTIRRAIEILKADQLMPIATGGQGRQGYFIPDPNNERDCKIAWDCYIRQMKQCGSIYASALPLKQFKPNDVMKLEEAV